MANTVVKATPFGRWTGAAFLILQHAIHPDLQRRGLALILDAIPEGQANPLDAAYLADRIAIFEGGEQTFGTQFDWTPTASFHRRPCVSQTSSMSAAPVSGCRRWLKPSPICAQTQLPKAMLRQRT